MNKPLAIGLIIFFILVIAGGATWLTLGPEAETETSGRGTILRFPFGLFGADEPTQPTPQPTPTTEEKQALVLLDQGPVESFSATKNGARYLLKQDGHVLEIGPKGGEQVRISNTTIPKIFEVAWSRDASKTILKYIEGANARVISAEFIATSTKAVVLPQNIISAVFAPDRDRIAYLIPTSSGARLITANTDNTKQTEITNLPFKDFDLFWPEKNSVYFSSRPSGSAGGFLFKYDLLKESLDKVLGDILGLQVKFSADGQKFAYSAYDSISKPRLYIYDFKTAKTADLQTATLADKCAFAKSAKNIIYCGIDQGMTPALYPDAWLKGEISSNDSLWQINLETGEKKMLTEQKFDIKQISPSDNDVFLYFIDKNNGSLWSLKLTD
ncbi:MAG: hypothetical protein AAB527_02925 [Patescibacteria group bacterium]